MRTDDFTKRPVGVLVSGSRVVIRCPSCRRNGALESRQDGARRCVHVELSALDDKVPDVLDRCDFVGPRSVWAGAQALGRLD